MTATIMNVATGEWYGFDTEEQGFAQKMREALSNEQERVAGMTYLECSKRLAEIKAAVRLARWWESEEMVILRKAMDAKEVTSTDEAKANISKEFLDSYAEWLADRANLSEREYSEKYGWGKSEKLMQLKDNCTAVAFFQKNIFSGRWTYEWERRGYPKSVLFALNREGFMSINQYDNRQARATGKTCFCYISQAVAKQIYKESKAK